MVDALLDAGADADAATLKGNTPLLFAANAGNCECARLLLERGARVNAQNKTDGDSSLHRCRSARRRRVEARKGRHRRVPRAQAPQRTGLAPTRRSRLERRGLTPTGLGAGGAGGPSRSRRLGGALLETRRLSRSNATRARGAVTWLPHGLRSCLVATGPRDCSVCTAS